MALSDDNSVFVGGEFGVSCTSGGTTANGILRQPTEVLMDGMVLFSDYTLETQASDFGSLISGNSITVDGNAYTVRDTRFSSDAQLVTISLQKT
jgi:hypothetical protein